MFKIIGGDQNEYGPVPEDEIREWVREGRANANTRARALDEEDWKPLSDFPEFADALREAEETRARKAAAGSRPQQAPTAHPPVPAESASALYHIVGSDQQQYGPVSRKDVENWILDGRASGQTMARAEGSNDWKLLAQFPEFANVLNRLPQSASAGYGAPSGRTNAMATTSMIMGILSLTCVCCCYGLPFNVLGLIFGLVAKSQIKSQGGEGSGMATAGIVMSIISLVLAVVILIGYVATGPERIQEIMEEFQRGL